MKEYIYLIIGYLISFVITACTVITITGDSNNIDVEKNTAPTLKTK